jgi:transposase
MDCYVGLDVSLEKTAVCVVDGSGVILKEAEVASDPSAIEAFVRTHAPTAKRIGLESGPTSTWLWRELDRLSLPVICIDARHAKQALSMQINKSDRNDAAGIARIMQTGWFRRVQVKSEASHVIRGLLTSRALLVAMLRDIENQIRGLLKNLGGVIGRAKQGVFTRRVRALLADRPELAFVIEPLLNAREDVARHLTEIDRTTKRIARQIDQARAFMTVPGVGPVTALAFMAAIDDPTRFNRSRTVGAYLGMTPRRHASGEIDWSGRISKCGDRMARSYLFAAAGVLLTRIDRWCKLKAWGLRIAKRSGGKKARVAVARKLAVLMHRMWRDGTTFQWKGEMATT